MSRDTSISLASIRACVGRGPKRMLPLCAAMLLVALPKVASSQSGYVEPANSCISSFYDEALYNLYSYRNSCSSVVVVAFVSRDGRHNGQMTLGPGRHNSTGANEREVAASGGFVAYACPVHYEAVDMDDKYIFDRPVARFRCKYQGY